MKVIWITGGSTGIGAATALKFAENNWKVVISSRNLDKLNLVKEKIINKTKQSNVFSIKCDISKKNEVINTINRIESEIGNINLALLNAAAYSPNKSQEFEIENFELLIDVNLKGTINCIYALQNIMEKRKSGHIAIVSSPVGYRGLPTAAAYGSTKAALINLAESLFFDFKKKSIKVSIINPGFIESESTKLNTFPMPFLKTSEFAANKIYQGLTKKYKFEIFFPTFFIYILKFLRILPYRVYFFIIKKFTGL
ncbi:MAG: putative oxidoreductase [Alphaproteobacteria bacterium MarineAlpha5_Bin9]|nr:MAG: putative oxidoreductase [Alphaproteobacteria bacterium MarineAlpha5_Bin9]